MCKFFKNYHEDYRGCKLVIPLDNFFSVDLKNWGAFEKNIYWILKLELSREETYLLL